MNSRNVVPNRKIAPAASVLKWPSRPPSPPRSSTPARDTRLAGTSGEGPAVRSRSALCGCSGAATCWCGSACDQQGGGAAQPPSWRPSRYRVARPQAALAASPSSNPTCCTRCSGSTVLAPLSLMGSLEFVGPLEVRGWKLADTWSLHPYRLIGVATDPGHRPPAHGLTGSVSGAPLTSGNGPSMTVRSPSANFTRVPSAL